MANPCYYHPDQTAVANCVQCGMAICEQCRDTVNDKTVCHRCVGAIRARLETEMANPAAAVVPSAYAPAAAAKPQIAAAAPPAAAGFLTGTGLGLLVAIVGAFLLDKFTFYTHIELGYINALVGFAIGFAVLFGAKRGGLVPGIIGGVLALVSALLGYYLLMCDEIARDGYHVPAGVLLRVFPHYLQHLNPLDWIIAAIGVYGGFKTPYRAGSQ